jgi:hypothetical protein
MLHFPVLVNLSYTVAHFILPEAGIERIYTLFTQILGWCVFPIVGVGEGTAPGRIPPSAHIVARSCD